MSRILIVEDTKLMRDSLVDVLGTTGHDIVTADNGARAVELVAGGAGFDIIVTDIIMPEMDGIETILELQTMLPAARIIAISGGSSRMEKGQGLETARRLGAEVTVVYRRERKDMPAIPEEIEAAEREGAKIAYLAAPHRIVGDKNGQVRAIEAVRTRPGEYDTSGRRRPVPTDEVIRIDCDTVILAVGEKVDADFCRASGLTLKEAGTIEVDRFSLETSRERFYAGGDLISGASNVSNAMGYGKKAARNIDKRLMGQKRFASLTPEFVYAMEAPESPTESARHVPGEMPAAARVQSYAEVSLGLTPAAAMDETARCLRCDIRSVER